MLDRVDIIIPTFNSPHLIKPCVDSILANAMAYPIRIIIINNGHPGIASMFPKDNPLIKFVQAPTNVGWEGGLKLGLEHSDAKFVMFANDDIVVPRLSINWIRNMMHHFSDKSVGAVGPSSNCVMGIQNIFNSQASPYYHANFLIGFCFLVRREALEISGGIDDTLPGGDDIDLSIRLRQNGYKLIAESMVFVYHHGFQTGEKVHGGSNVAGGWNSPEMTEAVNIALIRKHGFRTWYETLHYRPYGGGYPPDDLEGDAIRKFVKGPAVLELGCGNQKTVPSAVGLDYYGNGEIIPTLGSKSVADIKASATDIPTNIGKFDTIIARHILEHLVDPLDALTYWRTFLNDGGKLIIAVPNDALCDSVSLNPEHKHAFTPDSLRRLCSAAGFCATVSQDPHNFISTVLVADNVNIAREVQELAA